jgi:CRISPR/Cas system-associated exonuclease Cas4 (RecB family)
MTPRRTGLSKSRITLFEQCPKRLWLSVHRPELADEERAVTAGMAVGHEVGALACALLPDGRMIEADRGLTAAVEETAALLAAGGDKPVFEATFAHEDVLVRVDLMIPAAGGWQVAEVKSTTGLKDYHVADVATQLWVMRGNGVSIVSAAIRHLDRTFELAEEGNYEGLFADIDVGVLVEPIIASRSEVVAAARATLAGEEPVREPGAHCDQPFACSFKAYCGRDLPVGSEWPVSLLPDAAGKKIAREYAGRGIDDLLAVPADAMPNDRLRRVHTATLTGEVWHDAEAIRAETDHWAWPRTYLDFETIQFAIPRWIGTRPFEQVPFQFSAHIEQANGQLEHREFLSIDGRDPRRACAEALVELPQVGSVIAWNASFERGCLLGLAKLFPDLASHLHGLADRLVDLLPVVKRHYYHRDQRGSWSIKTVLPTIAPELAYNDLGVRSGTDAQAAYLQAIGSDAPLDRVEEIRLALLRYCERDTLAMQVLFHRMRSK